MNKKIKLVLGTMTFGESVFHPDVEAFIQTFLDAGYEELDTAYVYNEGRCEALLGEVIKKMGRDKIKISTKVNPRISGKLDGEAAFKQLNESLDRLGIDSVDTFYLHFPDLNTPVESVLEACAVLYDQGKYKELGLSNFPAWLAADVYHKCREHGWVLPTVYEGIYNPLTRKAETELNTALDYFGMRFYAYNPMAGGLLTGRYGRFEETPVEGRFTHRPNYQKRYWKKSYFDAADVIKAACERKGISIIEAVYRWLAYHSMLNERRGDAILVGASKLSHLKQNMEAVNAGPLPSDVADSFSSAWELCKADSPEYFTFYKGTAKE
ncbi:L-glyceraldehyde 3-phosphate reductase [uncultured Clostridium sp.]|nr:L-glyceraldehyde 3-phosphate reductase [uncultured Clostridium sp.]